MKPEYNGETTPKTMIESMPAQSADQKSPKRRSRRTAQSAPKVPKTTAPRILKRASKALISTAIQSVEKDVGDAASKTAPEPIIGAEADASPPRANRYGLRPRKPRTTTD